MGKTKQKSHRSSLKIRSVIRKKAKAKRERLRKEAKNKQYPKRTKKMLKAPQSMPFREMIEAQVHESSEFLNNVLRPIESTRTADKTKAFEKQQFDVKKQINEQFKLRVQEATASFQELTSSIAAADAVIEVLDARDPTACRLGEAENEVKISQSKPLLIILNKADLVPREIVIGWIHEMQKIGPTIAISAINADATLPLIQQFITTTVPQAKKIAVIGIAHCGKTTICNFNQELFVEVSSYKFIAPTAEMGLLQGAEYLNSSKDLAIKIMMRKADDNLFLALQIPVQETPGDVLDALAKKWQRKPHEAAKKFVDCFWSGTLKFYSEPEARVDSPEGLSESQVFSLSNTSVTEEMSAEVYVHLYRGDTLELNNQLLGIETEDNDEEEDDDDEDDHEE